YYSEPLAGFLLLLAFYFLARNRRLTMANTLCAGIALAAALMTRIDSLFVAPAIVLLLLLRILEDQHGSMDEAFRQSAATVMRRLAARQQLFAYALFAAPCAMFLAWYVIMNRIHFGGMMSSAYADQSEGIHFSTPLFAGLYGFF